MNSRTTARSGLTLCFFFSKPLYVLPLLDRLFISLCLRWRNNGHMAFLVLTLVRDEHNNNNNNNNNNMVIN